MIKYVTIYNSGIRIIYSVWQQIEEKILCDSGW